MDKKLNKLLVTETLNHIPSNIKLVDYYVETLGVSKESAYRRIRGENSFSFDEVCKLSLDLGFSIDKMVEQNSNGRVFFNLLVNKSIDPPKAFFLMLEQYYKDRLPMQKAENVESICALNRVPVLYTIFSDYLFKFMYYKWLHQNHEVPLKFYYSDVVIPQDILSVKEKLKAGGVKNRNNQLIVDPDVFSSLIKDIRYYYDRGLINDAELSMIKKDVSMLIDRMEDLVLTGFLTPKAKSDVYISSINISTTSMCMEYDRNVLSYFYEYFVNLIVIHNIEVCMLHKKWLNSQKRYATLITQSNEALQAEYFSRQREYLDLL
ncbi:MAG: hypothetical protein LBQ39_11125 [Tannerellaceae bacterium]|jgi:hypothetical protein|nr:hypothetical protein [Tannerellaceae bacterium]